MVGSQSCFTTPHFLVIVKKKDTTDVAVKISTRKQLKTLTPTLFVWLISHQPAILFSQNKSGTSNQSAVLSSQNKPAPAISHQLP
jgi:hypothetical protein